MSQTFGDYARSIRTNRRIPLKTVADALEFSSVYIADIERGRRNPPTADKIRLWANVIGADASEMFARAAIHRDTVELPLGDAESSRNRLALALARSWEDLTEEEENELTQFLETRRQQE